MSQESADPFIGYENMSAEQKLKVLTDVYETADSNSQRHTLEGRMMEVTLGMGEHPEWHENACLCDECLSCD